MKENQKDWVTLQSESHCLCSITDKKNLIACGYFSFFYLFQNKTSSGGSMVEGNSIVLGRGRWWG
jgi:hypothetical protein